ncbi:hypothetical protein SAMN05720766_102234 [Fibrobacter sp. UWH9]|uniref:hypothetical protein n=1 Tax=unclassified Fibrobacter TaxID=2634177 RepID=UPI00090FCFCC|nr:MULTISPECIES: hypothetical protein [Fibrobacter]MCQ2099366.1 hypothetical protein [Fibrobacter sp.]MCL4101001.1 hypothetical protein [Fibrobacter succinogenes]MDO4947014.1 hypothetical protein [Fibrobacter sp.]OWV06925.1 hypothetical protein B7993_03945 [Fibrobacter sp. UWH3]OWV16192.1 hypothetical protein B7992_03060 [Fibrobacter sp. UWH1]
MIDVLKAFYTVHYNFGAICVLLALLCIFFLTKKNFRGALIALAVIIALNVFIFKRTDGNAWTITIELPEETNSYGFSSKPDPIVMTFSALKNWTITDAKGEVHHWCWVDAYWDSFASMDLVAKIWGSNSSKKMMHSTESRADAFNGN